MTDQNETKAVTDATGRVIRYRMLSPLQEMDLYEAAGDLSENRRWMVYATFAGSVTQIDDKPAPFPTTKAEVRGRVDQLGAAGMKALIEAFTEEPKPGEAPAAT
jgi:hypothetical protein